MVLMSIIKATAIKFGVSCAEAFMSLAAKEYPSVIKHIELIRDFSEAACRSEYTDYLWKLASVESGFNHNIISVNANGRTSKVYRDIDEIKLYIKNVDRDIRRLKKRELKDEYRREYVPNLDVGILQLNFRFHGNEHPFDLDINKMFMIDEQVIYFDKYLVPKLKKSCKDKWLLCYHAPKKEGNQEKYRLLIEKATKKLTASNKEYMEELRANKVAKEIAIVKNDVFFSVKFKKISSEFYLANNSNQL